MQLITTEEQIRKLIPNVLLSVKGETPLIDKLAPFLDIAEEWAKQTFTSETLFAEICKLTDADLLRTFTSKVVVCEAFRNAVPSLDLVLTPNGFGIVNNSNIVPASKERVARLVDGLESERDRAIRLLLSALTRVEGWAATEQGQFFSASMFANLDICDLVGVREHQWDRYEELRGMLLDIEEHICTHFIGHEQYDAFRKEAMSPSGTSSELMKTVIRSLRVQEAQLLKARLSATEPLAPPSHSNLVHIVDIIKKHPKEFPLWHNSPISELFSPIKYENKKEDRAFWF